jgi:hypothetical protein
MMLEALLVLQGVMGAVNNKATFHIMDQRNSAAFTIPHKLYDEASKEWIFNKQELLVKFKALETEIRNH